MSITERGITQRGITQIALTQSHNARRQNLNRKKKFDNDYVLFLGTIDWRFFRSWNYLRSTQLVSILQRAFVLCFSALCFSALCLFALRVSALCLLALCLCVIPLYVMAIRVMAICVMPLRPFAESACCHSALDWCIYDLEDFISNTDQWILS